MMMCTINVIYRKLPKINSELIFIFKGGLIYLERAYFQVGFIIRIIYYK